MSISGESDWCSRVWRDGPTNLDGATGACRPNLARRSSTIWPRDRVIHGRDGDKNTLRTLPQRLFAQLLAVCRASTRAEALRIASLGRRQVRAKKRLIEVYGSTCRPSSTHDPL